MPTLTFEPGSPEAAAPQAPRNRRWSTAIRTGSVLLAVPVIGVCTLAVVTQFATREKTANLAVDEQLRALKVDVHAGDVQIRDGQADGPVRIEVTTRSALREARWTHSVEDGVLDLTGVCEGAWPIDNCSVGITVVVPSGADLDVDVHTGAGDQRVSGVGGAAALRTGSGDIQVSAVRGALDARTGSGDIRAGQISSPSVQMRTGSGDVRAELLAETSRVELRTGSGDIHAGFQMAPTEVISKTGSGDLRIFVPDDGSAYDVSGDTGSGDRQIAVRTGSNTRSIDASTGSGDVQIGVH